MLMVLPHVQSMILLLDSIGILWFRRKDVMNNSFESLFSFIFMHGLSSIRGICDDRIDGNYFLHATGVMLNILS